MQASNLLEVIGMIDWLLVLYEASDVLHNEIEVGGLALDHQYVPEVFYSDKGHAQKDEFALEMAAMRLGKGVADEDALEKLLVDEIFFRHWTRPGLPILVFATVISSRSSQR